MNLAALIMTLACLDGCDDPQSLALSEKAPKSPVPTSQTSMTTAAPSVPQFGFKTFVLGEEYAPEKAGKKYFCVANSDGDPTNDQHCRLWHGNEETFGGVTVAEVDLLYYGNRLGSIDVYFDASDFAGVALALAEKYGKPKAKTETVQNAMGASFGNDELTWHREGERMILTRREGRVDRSHFQVVTNAYLEEFGKRYSSLAKKNASDL